MIAKHHGTTYEGLQSMTTTQVVSPSAYQHLLKPQCDQVFTW